MADLATKDLRRRLKKFGFWFILLTLTMSAVITYSLVNSGLSFFAISGISMEPTLKNGSSVILKQEKGVRRNQIIFFDKPSVWSDYVDTNTTLVKRIIAIPGDTLSYREGIFYVNDDPFYNTVTDDYDCSAFEKSLDSKSGSTDNTNADSNDENIYEYSHVLSKSEIFVTGDNAHHSLDSRRVFCDGSPDTSFVPRMSIKDYGRVVKIF